MADVQGYGCISSVYIFFSSGIAYCISPYASFYAGLSCLIIYYCQRDLTLGVFYRNIGATKISIFVNVDLDLHFQGHLLQ